MTAMLTGDLNSMESTVLVSANIEYDRQPPATTLPPTETSKYSSRCSSARPKTSVLDFAIHACNNERLGAFVAPSFVGATDGLGEGAVEGAKDGTADGAEGQPLGQLVDGAAVGSTVGIFVGMPLG